MSPAPLAARGCRRDALREAAEVLEKAGVPSARHDAEELLAHVLGVGRTDLHAGAREALPPGVEARFRALVERRSRREPLQYIVGVAGFRGLVLATRPGSLIPRPETESLAGYAIEALRDARAVGPLVLEVGTGTGAIAIAIAAEVEGARIVATDISSEALRLAAENAARAGVAERIALVRADCLAAIRPGACRFHAVVSNPPYVRRGEIAGLMPEVRLWEPALALAGGEDGMLFHEAIAREALDRLVPGGTLLLEVADGQAGAVARLLDAAGYAGVRALRDLAGIERVVRGSRAGD